MIYIGENKSVLCKGDYHPAELYKGDKKITGYSLEEFTGSGIATLENCYNDKVYNVSLSSKNLMNVKELYPNYANNKGGITLHSGQLSAFSSTQKRLEGVFKENTRYTFSLHYNISEDTETSIIPQIWYTDGTRTYMYIGIGGGNPHIGEGEITLTSYAGKTVSYFNFTYGSNSKRYEAEFSNMMIEEGATATEYEPYLADATVTVRGKNYFDLAKVPFSNSTTQPYNNGLIAKKVEASNSGNKIPITLPVGKEIKMTMEVVDSQIGGTTTRVTMGFYNKSGTRLRTTNVSSTIGKKSYTFTLDEEVSYIQFYFQADDAKNVVGDYVTMDNIMLRVEGDDTYEYYVEPQTIAIENGTLAADIPTFKGTTIIDVAADVEAHISGSYKKWSR